MNLPCGQLQVCKQVVCDEISLSLSRTGIQFWNNLSATKEQESYSTGQLLEHTVAIVWSFVRSFTNKLRCSCGEVNWTDLQLPAAKFRVCCWGLFGGIAWLCASPVRDQRRASCKSRWCLQTWNCNDPEKLLAFPFTPKALSPSIDLFFIHFRFPKQFVPSGTKIRLHIHFHQAAPQFLALKILIWICFSIPGCSLF